MHRYGLTIFALILAPAAHAESAPPAPPKWTASLGGSTSMVDGQNSQPTVNFSVRHGIGKGYIGLSGAVTDSSNDQAPVGLSPTRIEVFTLSGGRQFGRFMLGATVAVGRGVFEQGVLPVTATQDVAVSSKAHGYGLGASASLNLKLAKNLVLTPTLGINYSLTRVTRRAVDRATWPGQLEKQSKAVSVSGGGALQRRFGASHQHGLTVMATVLRLGNASDFILRPGRSNPADLVPGSSDTLVDYGAALNLGLPHKMGINLSATRSAFASGSQSTVLGVGLNIAF